MTVELSRRLLASGVPSSDIEAALFLSVARGIPVARALIDRGAVSERALEEELSRWAGIALRQVTASTELWARLPMSMCRRLGALPLRVDTATGTVDVAAIDPLDPHVGAEFSFHLGMPVRVLRATLGAIEEAVRRLELGETDGAATRNRRRTPAFPHGAPKSSSPPPPTEDVPIPLMRRVAPPLPNQDDDDSEISLVNRGARPMPSDPSQPSVSFPSSPPPAHDRRLTPAPMALAPMVLPITTPPPPLAITRPPPPSSAVTAPPPPSAAETTPPPPMLSTIAPYPTGDRSITPAMAFPVLLPPRSMTPLMGTVPAVKADSPLEPVSLAHPATERDWYAPSEEMEAGFRRAGLETLPPPTIADSGPPEHIESERPASVRRPVGAPLSAADDTEELQALPQAPPPLPSSITLNDALDLLGDAQGRDGVVEAALAAMSLLATRGAVFVVKRDGYHGWACSPEFGDRAALRSVVLPHNVPSILATATAAGFYLGPVPNTPGHAALLRVMRDAGPDVAVSVVRVAGKPAIVLIAEGLDDTLRGTRALGEVAKVAGFALSRVLASR